MEIDSSSLPIFVINTNNQVIPSDEKITVELGIINNTTSYNYFDENFNDYNGLIKIETRGASSSISPKKSYAFKTIYDSGEENNVSLLDLPIENDWILYAPYIDKSLIRNVICYELANQMGYYSSKSKFCELVLDNQYMGIYMLMEKIKRDNKRVDIDQLNSLDTNGMNLTGGYIVKIDKELAGENNDGWQVGHNTGEYDSIYYQYHYPESDAIMEQQKDYIKEYIIDFESLMISDSYNHPIEGYYDRVDIHSFLHMTILNTLSKNIDGFRYSFFLHKDKDNIDDRLTFGPIWDYDRAFGNASYQDAFNPEDWFMDLLIGMPFWVNKIWNDSIYRNYFNIQTQAYFSSILSENSINTLIDSLVNEVEHSINLNFQVWPILSEQIWPNYYVGGNYENEIVYLKNWILNRRNWMTENIGHPNINYISNIKINEFLTKNNSSNYDENGEYEDWIELYNTTADSVLLSGYYLSDDPSNLTKWPILYNYDGVIIEPEGYLTIWCDKEESEGQLHANFKLNQNEGCIYLTYRDGSTIVDHVCYNNQYADVSLMRYPDGDANWEFTLSPTLGESNVYNEIILGCTNLQSINFNPEANVDDGSCMADYTGIVINEFLAINDTTNIDEFGEFDDWIEIYNIDDYSKNIGGVYISDNKNNLTKWIIPQSTIIQANGFLIIWCDEDSEQGILHSNFKLSGGGEFLSLVYNDGVTFIDSLSYTSQLPDISFGRAPDGSAEWRAMSPSPNSPNPSLKLSSESPNPKEFFLHNNYPNPFNLNTSLRYDLPEDIFVKIFIYDILGRIVKILVNRSQTAGFKSIKWDGTNDRNEQVSAGLYFYTIQAGDIRKAKKMMLLK